MIEQTLPASYPQVPEAFRYALRQPQRAIPMPPVEPENEVLRKGTDVVGTSCRDCHGLKPNEWFDGKYLGRFRRWMHRGDMCTCNRTLSSVTAGLKWPKPTGGKVEWVGEHPPTPEEPGVLKYTINASMAPSMRDWIDEALRSPVAREAYDEEMRRIHADEPTGTGEARG